MKREHPDILCACGCGTSISFYGKNGKPRRFLQGHQTNNTVLPRDEKYWSLRLRKLHTRAKLCACGCGGRVLVSLLWLKENGAQGRTIWLPKYKAGHDPLVQCACGCGAMVSSVDSRNQPRSCVPQHAARLATRVPVDWEARVQTWESIAPFCKCGCGSLIQRTAAQLQNYHAVPEFLVGHGSRRSVCVPELSREERSVILGTRYPRLEFTHCIAQKAYAIHKMEVLARLSWFSEEAFTSGYKSDAKGIVHLFIENRRNGHLLQGSF